MNINAEFSAEEFETALITPNDTLGDIHIPLLKVGSFFSSTLKKFYFILGASNLPFFLYVVFFPIVGVTLVLIEEMCSI